MASGTWEACLLTEQESSTNNFLKRKTFELGKGQAAGAVAVEGAGAEVGGNGGGPSDGGQGGDTNTAN